MGLLQRMRLRRAAKHYAQRLGAHLQHAYGASEHYTAPQIRAAVAKLGLNADFIALGYAAFLPEEAFASLATALPIYIAYDDARELLERFRPPALTSAAASARTNFDMIFPDMP